MASASGIRAGLAYVELTLKDNSLVKGLKDAQKKLTAFGTAIADFGKKVAAAGAAVVAPLLASAKGWADAGARMYEMSQRTGIGVEALSALAFAASQSGVEIDTLEVGVRKMQKGIVEAANGSASAQEALALLGLTVKDLDQLAPEQQFKLIADRLSKVKDPTIQAALAMEFFGRSGTELLPLIKGGAQRLDAYAKQAEDLGLIMSGPGAQGAKELEDAMVILTKVGKKLWSTLGAALQPLLLQVAQTLINAAVAASAWLKQNQALVVTIFKVGAAVMAAGLLIFAIGKAIALAGAIFGGIAGVITTVSTAVGVLGAILGVLLNPITLVIGGVVALGAYLLWASGAGGEALKWLSDKFTALKDFALKAWQGIGDALAAGDIGLAVRILWLSLKLAWENGVAQLQQIWLTFSGAFLKVAYGAFYGTLAAAEYVWHAMKVVWIEGVAFLQGLWAKFVAWHATAVEGMADTMVKAWIWAREKTGKIDARQAGFERDAAAQQHQQATNQISADRNAALNQAEQQRQAAENAEKERHDSRLNEIGKGYNDAAAQVEADRAAKEKKTQEALAQARKEWQDAIAEAKKKRDAKEAEDKGPGKPPLPNVNDQFGGLADLLDQAAKHTIGVAGTFNPLEARGLGAGGVADRIANATEATAKNTKKLVEKLQGGNTFK